MPGPVAKFFRNTFSFGCMKLTLVLINTFFLVGSVVAFFWGLHLLLEAQENAFLSHLDARNGSAPYPPPNVPLAPHPDDMFHEELSGDVLMIISLITLAISLMGVVAAKKESFCLMVLFCGKQLVIALSFPLSSASTHSNL